MEQQQQSGRNELDKRVSEEISRLMDRVHLAEMLLDASIDQVIAIDTERDIISWNRACEAFTKKTPEDVLGRPLIEVLPIYESSGVEGTVHTDHPAPI